MKDDIDAVLDDYRAELAANAALGEAELVELEDHFRTLIEELRGAGAVTAAVVAEARRRIGDPRVVAGECARVRTAFGTRLDRARAWAAGSILLALAAWTAWITLPHAGLVSRVAAEIALGTILAAGLIARRTWPRAILVGYCAASTAVFATFNALFPGELYLQLSLAASAAPLALLLPWRRGGLTAAGWALAAWAVAYVGASFGVIVMSTGAGVPVVEPLTRPSIVAFVLDVAVPALALFGVALAALGTVLRARWGVAVGFVTAGLIVALVLRIAGTEIAEGSRILPGQWWIGMTMAVFAAAAGIAAPLLAWRSTRPGRGELRSLLAA